MLLVIHRSFAVIARFRNIAVDNHLAVQNHLDVVAFRDHFLIVPFAYRFQCTAFGGNHPVNRTVILVRFEILIDRCVVIENLQLHPYIGGIALGRGTDTETVVRSRRQLELEAENEVLVLVLRVKVAAVAALVRNERNHAVVADIIARIADPLVHVGTVEQHLETLFLLFGRKFVRFGAGQLVDVEVAVIDA